MILQKMELTVGVEWLDPEGADKEKRKEEVVEFLLKLFTHEFGVMATRHGLKIELVCAK